jgi:ribosomal-protein-alanine N-acetyltransferase
MTPPLYEIGDLSFTWPTSEQVVGYYEAIIGTRLFDTLLWNGPSHVDELHEFWRQRRADYESGAAHTLSLAVIETTSGRMIGSGSLRPVLVAHGVWDLGFALAPAWQGHGRGSVLVSLLVGIAFAERGAERVEADVFAGNHASRRVLEKAGLLLEGVARSAVAKPDGRRDLWLLGMTRADWLVRVPPGGAGG